MEKLSTIITAYDHHQLTAAHVRECMNSNRIPDEIIVINDGGDPSLRELLLPIKKKCPVIYARINEDILWNYNGACNLGVWLSKGDFLAFEDNDNIPTRTFYDDVLAEFEKNPSLGRVHATRRLKTYHEDMITKPLEEWRIIGTWHPNQGTATIRRELYLRLKGQDEGFAGGYGWMFYDLKRRMIVRLDTKMANVGEYYYAVDAQSNLSRSQANSNLKTYRRNMKMDTIHSNRGILNFTYTFEIMT